MVRIDLVTEQDLEELLPLMRGYCDFYEVNPNDAALLALCRSLLADPELEGVQFIARSEEGAAIGFATLFWTWTTTRAGRLGVMNDLFVSPDGRGTGAADALIRACEERCRERGAVALEWQTALDNHRAQVVYARVGGKQSRWLSYGIDLR